MTPRQIDRAVNAALLRIMPPLVQQLRDDLRATLTEQLAARDASAGAALAPPALPVAPKSEELVAALSRHAPLAAAAPPTTTQRSPRAAGKGKKLCDAMVERARLAYFEAGGSLAQAAAKASIPKTTISTLAGRLGWRAMLRGAPAPVAIGLDLASQPDVQVAQVVPAARHPHTPTPAAPMDPAQLEPVPASYEDALDWLFAHLVREGLNMAEVETRLAQLSTKQLLATCNAQRVKAGLSPYVLTERAA